MPFLILLDATYMGAYYRWHIQYAGKDEQNVLAMVRQLRENGASHINMTWRKVNEREDY